MSYVTLAIAHFCANQLIICQIDILSAHFLTKQEKLSTKIQMANTTNIYIEKHVQARAEEIVMNSENGNGEIFFVFTTFTFYLNHRVGEYIYK